MRHIIKKILIVILIILIFIFIIAALSTKLSTMNQDLIDAVIERAEEDYPDYDFAFSTKYYDWSSQSYVVSLRVKYVSDLIMVTYDVKALSYKEKKFFISEIGEANIINRK